MKLKSKPTKKKSKTPRKEQRPRTAPTQKKKGYAEAECEDWTRGVPDSPQWWDAKDDVEYITFNSVKEFQDYVRAIGESLEIDPEGIH